MTTSKATFPHVVIRASAGTGKTFQLANRFLGLASAEQPVDRILAATFARKAAGEILRVVALAAVPRQCVPLVVAQPLGLAGCGQQHTGQQQ